MILVELSVNIPTQNFFILFILLSIKMKYYKRNREAILKKVHNKYRNGGGNH